MARKRSSDHSGPELVSWEQYLRESAVPRDIIDDFLQRPNWSKFDPDLGYALNNSLVQWGVDGSRTIETLRSNGARTAFLYADRKPRLNSYGNSFTEGNQVSDGETWQEYLAAHFCEPVGNYGVGGYGVYQAYHRMLSQEQTDDGAEYIILYVWGDDPTRSLMRARWAANYRNRWEQALSMYRQGQRSFSGNPWAHIEMDLSTGRFVEKENPLSTPESLYEMCDPEWMLDHLRDDMALQLVAYGGRPEYGWPGRILDLDKKKVDQLADALDFRIDWSAGAETREQAAALLNIYGQRATNIILDKARAYTQSHGKKLLVVLNFTARPDYWNNSLLSENDGARYDQEILDHLDEEEFTYFDMNEVHEREYQRTTGPFHEYIGQYEVGGRGHYNPRGNHLFAYSIKDTLLGMLDPKPLPYQNIDAEAVDFDKYLAAAADVTKP